MHSYIFALKGKNVIFLEHVAAAIFNEATIFSACNRFIGMYVIIPLYLLWNATTLNGTLGG